MTFSFGPETETKPKISRRFRRKTKTKTKHERTCKSDYLTLKALLFQIVYYLNRLSARNHVA